MAEVPKHEPTDAAESKSGADQAKPEPPKPIAIGDVIDGWTVDAINGQDVMLSSGAERRSRPLADLEHEREAGAPSKVAVGDVIDGWTVLAINNPTDVQVAQGAERRSLTVKDLENAKRSAQALTEADLARTKAAAPAAETGKAAGTSTSTR